MLLSVYARAYDMLLALGNGGDGERCLMPAIEGKSAPRPENAETPVWVLGPSEGRGVRALRLADIEAAHLVVLIEGHDLGREKDARDRLRTVYLHAADVLSSGGGGAPRQPPCALARAKRASRILLLADLLKGSPVKVSPPWYGSIATASGPPFGAWAASAVEALKYATRELVRSLDTSVRSFKALTTCTGEPGATGSASGGSSPRTRLGKRERSPTRSAADLAAPAPVPTLTTASGAWNRCSCVPRACACAGWGRNLILSCPSLSFPSDACTNHFFLHVALFFDGRPIILDVRMQAFFHDASMGEIIESLVRLFSSAFTFVAPLPFPLCLRLCTRSHTERSLCGGAHAGRIKPSLPRHKASHPRGGSELCNVHLRLLFSTSSVLLEFFP